MQKNQHLITFLAIAGYVLSVLYNLGYTELDGEEPRRALVSIEMLHSGNFMVPTLYGWDYYNKPPLFNWILSGFIFLFQSAHEWVIRLPSLVFILIWAHIHYRFTRLYLDDKTALLSSLFLLTCGDLYFYGLQNGGEIDIFYALVVYLQVVSIFYFFEKKRWDLLFITSYFFCAVGFLTKAFPSIIFQGLSLLALVFYARSLRVLLRWQHLVGLFIFFLVAGSYFLLYHQQADAKHYLLNLLNESIRKTPLTEQSKSVWQNITDYPVRMFTGLLPWSLIVFFLFRKPRPSFIQNPFLRYSLLFVACNIGVYWFFGVVKLRYSYVFFAFISLWLAVIYNHYRIRVNEKKILRFAVGAILLVGLSVVIMPVFSNIDWVGYFLVLVLFLVFSWQYFKKLSNTIFFFGLGIILTRFAYAAIFLPYMDSQRDSTRYREPMNKVAQLTGNQPISFYAEPDTLIFDVDMKVASIKGGQELVAPEIFKQVPYYYYLATGHPVLYDTIVKRELFYFGYHYFIPDTNRLQKQFSFYDSRMQADFMLFRAK